ncbi:MAG: non-homologous end-joining DNA ligase [Deltaproteobacteria bacterium]
MAKASPKLAKYRAKRDFELTAEPSGAEAAAAGHRYVIQQHAASRMHYDFRLELDGVLLSWAVPKGPSLSPKERRLAARTEDHPLNYHDFEGIIPAGQYGGGTVSVWDRGSWAPEGGDEAARKGLADGKLTFVLHGEKLHGRWHLVRTKPQGKPESWLLFKGRDEAADDKLDIITAKPASVKTGRTLDQIAASADDVWQANREPVGEPAKTKLRKLKAVPADTPPDLIASLRAMDLGFELTNLDKVLYPEQGITKSQLVGYFAVAAERMLPHVAERPLMAVRCPDGRTKCFFQKHVLKGSPKPILRVPIEDSEAVKDHMAVKDRAGLVALAQLGILEVHTWGTHLDKIERPDIMVFDLDPDVGVAWDRVALAAIELRGLLHELDLASFVKTTGGKGLHVCVPFERKLEWDQMKAFTKSVSEEMERRQPTNFTTKLAKVHRKGRIFIDYLRNARGATFVAPYSPRARAGAPVATPITWEELARRLTPDRFTIKTMPGRLGEPDPWADYVKTKQSVTAAARKAVKAP